MLCLRPFPYLLTDLDGRRAYRDDGMLPDLVGPILASYHYCGLPLCKLRCTRSFRCLNTAANPGLQIFHLLHRTHYNPSPGQQGTQRLRQRMAADSVDASLPRVTQPIIF